jgi:hypothetical protein
MYTDAEVSGYKFLEQNLDANGLIYSNKKGRTDRPF